MKHMRKLITLVIVLAMVMAFMVPTAMAAEIAVQNVVNGEEYTAYKILNYTNSGTAYSYYLTAAEYTSIGSTLEAAGFAFTASADGTQYFVNNVGTIDVAAAAEYLAANLTNLGNALGKFTAEGASGQANFTGLTKGYYFVTTTTGSLCALHSDTDIATAVEKNTVPTIDKKQGVSAGTYGDAFLDMNMGDTIYYQIEVTDGKGTNKDIVLTDTATAGIKLDTSIAVTKNGTAVATENYTVENAAEAGFKLTLKAAYVSTLDEGDKVVITYTATVDTDATVDNATANYNKVTMTYSEQTAEDTVYVATYDFLVKKTDGTNFLDGAEFRLYDALTGGNEIKLATDGTGCYKSATGNATIDINVEAGVNVRGLKPGTYYLEEVVVPDGYNKLAARQAITITSGATSAVEVEVENQAGAVLPSTGGIGTTIFYILGSLMFIGAAVVLVTNKRMGREA